MANTHQKLAHAIREYLQWLEARAYRNTKARMRYEQVLRAFLAFVKDKDIAWEDTFTLDTLKGFRTWCSLPNPSHALRGLSGYLYAEGKIPQPLRLPNYQIDLPDIYEEYLHYHEQSKQITYRQIKHRRRLLASFHEYLERANISLSRLTIEQVDSFLATFCERLAPATCKTYRSYLRGFLTYLYQERGILNRDLAPLVRGNRLYAQAKPPKFLRPHEVQRLFAGLRLASAADIRTYAMVHLAYSLGLRPSEISKISLDDIAFGKGELTLPDTKSTNPLVLPLPEHTIKAITAYLVSARPESTSRRLFVSFQSPYRPISAETVGRCITRAMKQAGLCSSAYWLRHTYAQNLLESGGSIFEIKEMLGHDKIESTKNYLHIHIALMRKVLFDETL
jgi:site-specific recombinase XerD